MKARGIPPLGVKNQKNLRTDGKSMRPLNYSKRSHSCTLTGLRQIHCEPTQAKTSTSTARSQRFDGAANTEEQTNEKDLKCS